MVAVTRRLELLSTPANADQETKRCHQVVSHVVKVYTDHNNNFEAVAAATKANNVSTWKAVCFACLRADEFRLAATCGLQVIKYPDHVDEVVAYYSDLGHFTHLVSLFEQGLGLEDAHVGIFTELGVLYTKHVPDKVMEHCKVFFSKLNVFGKQKQNQQQQRLVRVYEETKSMLSMPAAAIGIGSSSTSPDEDGEGGEDGEKVEECEEAWDYVEFLKENVK